MKNKNINADRKIKRKGKFTKKVCSRIKTNKQTYNKKKTKTQNKNKKKDLNKKQLSGVTKCCTKRKRKKNHL